MKFATVLPCLATLVGYGVGSLKQQPLWFCLTVILMSCTALGVCAVVERRATRRQPIQKTEEELGAEICNELRRPLVILCFGEIRHELAVIAVKQKRTQQEVVATALNVYIERHRTN